MSRVSSFWYVFGLVFGSVLLDGEPNNGCLWLQRCLKHNVNFGLSPVVLALSSLLKVCFVSGVLVLRGSVEGFNSQTPSRIGSLYCCRGVCQMGLRIRVELGIFLLKLGYLNVLTCGIRGSVSSCFGIIIAVAHGHTLE